MSTEPNIPIPPSRRTGITAKIREMNVGDSLEIPSKDVTSWLTCAYQLRPRFKMTVRKGENGNHRIWRKE